KKDKNFMYKNLERSNCYNCDFSGSNFDSASFRGAHFKSCSFFKCSFKWAEFTGTNLKGSNFRNAVFENAVFNSAKLESVDFKGAEFKNTIFLCTDVEKAKNLNVNSPGIRIYNEMPQLNISEELNNALLNVLKNRHVKASRVMDTKDGGINILSVMILSEKFDESTLIKGLEKIQNELDRDFYTLSYIVRFLENCTLKKEI
ncbi:MAG: pentapeptide repeat-containing protein, partial [Clostridiaceae bacterium]